MSVMVSAPNFSRKASARTTATIDSPITAAAGTAQESARSLKARAGSPVGRARVGSGGTVGDTWLPDPASSRHGAGVRPLFEGPRGLAGREVDGAQCSGDGR